ncbi:HRDC domain-containing protein, partial [Clostridium perfringens]
ESEVYSEEKSNNDNFNDEVLFNRDNKSYEGKILSNKNKEELRRKLKQLRINFAIKEKLPPYCIFNDETLNDLLDKMPKNKEELMKVKGLAKVKVNKYGEEILGVLN